MKDETITIERLAAETVGRLASGRIATGICAASGGDLLTHEEQILACREIRDLRAAAAAPSDSSLPIHPVEVIIRIGGESFAYIQHRLRDLANEAHQRDASCFQMYGGGAGGSYSVTTTQRDISPADFRRELDEWFEKQTPKDSAA